MGEVFEEICQQYLFLPGIYETLPFPVGKVGHWWGNNPKKKCQEEIDLMFIYEDKVLIGECKWKNEKVEMRVIEKLLERGELFSYKEKNYIIFSKSGFSEEVIEYARVNKNIRLVNFEKMCKRDNA